MYTKTLSDLIDLGWGRKISLLCRWGAVFFVMWFIYVRVTQAPPSYEWFILAIKVFRMDCVYKEDASQPFELPYWQRVVCGFPERSVKL
jgi:hypothetical protein